MAVEERLDQILRRAIAEKRLIRFEYKGKERIVEPHDYGIEKRIARLLSWQVGGQSDGRIPEWRWFDVGDMQSSKCWTGRFPEIETFRASIISGTKSSYV
jgi:hypothetical protein